MSRPSLAELMTFRDTLHPSLHADFVAAVEQVHTELDRGHSMQQVIHTLAHTRAMLDAVLAFLTRDVERADPPQR